MSGTGTPGAADPRLRVAAIGWTALIVVLCLLPASWLGLGAVEESTRGLPLPPPDKLVHTGLFAVFAALWVSARPGRSRLPVVAAGWLLAAATELAQDLPFIARDGNLPDALADILGIAAGTVLAGWRVARNESPKKLADS